MSTSYNTFSYFITLNYLTSLSYIHSYRHINLRKSAPGICPLPLGGTYYSSVAGWCPSPRMILTMANLFYLVDFDVVVS